MAVTGALYLFIWTANGFVKGSNHYAGQFLWLFPITKWTIISGIACLIIYFTLLVINMGVLPIISVWFSRGKYEKTARWWCDFVLISIAFLLVEIVVLIVLTEEGVPTVPHKFLFRYFHILAPPVLILFMKNRGEPDFLETKEFSLLSVGSCMITFFYFLCMQGNTRQAIADGYLYLLLENVTKNILPYADAIVIFLAGCILAGMSALARRKKESIMKVFIKFGIIGIAFLWLINCVQLPVYTNLLTGGKATQKDSVKVAEYLNENEYEFIYYVVTSIEESDSYARNFYGYMKQPHRVVFPEELEQILENGGKRKAAFLAPTINAEQELQTFQLKKAELQLEKYTVYYQEF
ncbi:MAG: hypothetical protein NC400_00745 [Clostridium sp.]|nr:hypothetical protein [Clostridium sp.]